MNPFKSVGAKLSLALVAVVACALALVWAIVVPSLERSLVNAKLSQLETAAPTIAERLPIDPFKLPDYLETSANSTNARVVVYTVVQQQPPVIGWFDDSTHVDTGDVNNDPIALRTAETGVAQSGEVMRGGRRYAEAAAPEATGNFVVLLRTPLRDSLGNVHLVQRRLIVAGAVALLASLLVGYGLASLFARRIRRLERAAERIAGGEFDEPVVDRGGDELSELAATFERMRERLAQLDHARREFIANASHELRTPVFSLGGFLELLADEELDEPTRREFLESMQEQVERLEKLATELLDLSRLDAGRLRVEPAPLNLAGIARALAEEFSAVARSGDRPLQVSADGAVAALADPQRALQIGRTLVENALRHTPPGTPVRVSAERRADRAALVVVDAGQGIPAEHVPHVFERFYRVDGALASGSGLGLAIARELAELMGGTIDVESRPGRTTFTLILPAAAHA